MKNKQKAQSFLIRARAKFSAVVLVLAIAGLALDFSPSLSAREPETARERLAKYIFELNHEDESVRAKAEKQLGREDVEFLKAAVRMSREARRQGTATLIVSHMGETAVSGLIELLSDAELGGAAGSMLATVASPVAYSHVPALLDCLVKSGFGNYCGVALVKVMSPKASRYCGKMIEAMENGKPLVRAFAAAGLGEIGPKAKAAVPALQTALSDSEESVRLAAVVALGKIGRKAREAAPAVEAAANDRSAEVRREAREALRKITGS